MIKKLLKPLISTVITFIIITVIFAIIYGPNDLISRYYFFEALQKKKLNYSEEAIESYTKSIKYNNNHVNAFLNRGSLFLDLSKYEKAISDYNTVLIMTPNNSAAYAYKGRVFYEQNKIELALQNYNKSIEIDTNFAYAYYNRGLLLYSVKFDFEKGCKDLKIAEKLGHKHAIELLKTGNCK